MIVLGPAFFRAWFLSVRAMGNEVGGDNAIGVRCGVEIKG
jgi:hypothetical protein